MGAPIKILKSLLSNKNGRMLFKIFRGNFRRISSTHCSEYPVDLAHMTYDSSPTTESTDSPDNSALSPILIMHGLLGSKTNWNTLAKAFHRDTKRKVIVADARNHGDSPHSSEMTYDHMAKDIVRLTDRLNVKKTILIGHSMGGSTVMWLALNYPQLVEKLVVVDMSPVRTSGSLASMSKILEAVNSAEIEAKPTLTATRAAVDRQLSREIHSKALRQFLLMNLVEDVPGAYKWRVNLPVLISRFGSEIAAFPRIGNERFEGPTLFIAGAESDYVKKDDHATIRNLFPRAEFTYVSGAGHWVQSDKPAEFLKLVVDFVNRRDL